MSIEQIRQQAQDEKTAPAVLAKLATSEDYITRGRVAANKNTSSKTIEYLSNDSEYRVREAMARHLKTTVNILEKLKNDRSQYVRQAVAENPNTSSSILEELLKDKAKNVVKSAKYSSEKRQEATCQKSRSPHKYFFISISIEQTRQQAQDENTPPEILAELANSEDYITLQYIAANPNTPIDILEKLSNDFPEAVTANPVFSLLLLEQPDNNFFRLALARSSTTSVDSLERLLKTEDIEILCEIAKNKNTSISILEKLISIENLNHNDYVARCIVAVEPKIPLFLMKRLAEDKSEYVRHDLALNSSIPIEILEKLAQDNSHYVCRGVASNPKTLLLLLEQLANNKNIDIRKELIDNPVTSLSIFQKLVKNKNLTVSLKTKLASQTAFSEILEQLVNVPNLIVRQTVASNPNTPTLVLDKLLSDNKRYIHEFIAKNPNSSDAAIEIVNFVLGNIEASSDLLVKLATSEHLYLRNLVAKNSLTPNNTLLKLAEDKNIKIQKSLLFRKDLNLKILERILQTTIEDIQAKPTTIILTKASYIVCLIARHSNAGDCIFKTLLAFLCDRASNTSSIHIDRIKITMLKNPNIPLEIIRELACN